MTDQHGINYNYAVGTNAKIIIHRLKGVELFATANQLPGIRAQSVNVPTPQTTATFPGGGGIEFEPLVVDFIVNEDFTNYFSVIEWMYEANVPNTPRSRRQTSSEDIYNPFSDLTLYLLDNNMVEFAAIEYVNAHPTSIGQIQFAVDVTSPTPIKVPLTLEYDFFRNITSDLFK